MDTNRANRRTRRIEETVERVAGEIVRNGEVYRAEQEERKRAREKYRLEQKSKKEKESILLEEIQV